MARTICDEKLINLGYSDNLRRDLIIAFKVVEYVYCDSQIGVQLLVRPAHKHVWGAYTSMNMVEAKCDLEKFIDSVKLNYRVKG